MMSSKLKWLLVIQLLLSEQVLCRVPPSLAPRNSLLLGTNFHEDLKETTNQDNPSKLGLPPPAEKPHPVSVAAQEEERVKSAELITSVLREKLQDQIQDYMNIQKNVSCAELLSASTLDDPSSSLIPQELLGLSLVPVLAVAGCTQEAQTLVLRLYELLGEADTDDLLMEVEALIESRRSKIASTPAPPSAAVLSVMDRDGSHIEALMFNIQQLALVGEGSFKQEGHCDGWSRVNGTTLVGRAVEGAAGDLKEAVSTCERLEILCAGVSSSGPLKYRKYQALLREGSRILPSESSETESWIRQCSTEEDVSTPAGSSRRLKRSLQRSCINRKEQRVYHVVEWIPGVSTLYNLGTAVYYASVNCSETAKERAILSAVDLGTDALMVATGGTAGVAGYALGAGVKTGVKAGVKYLLNSMKQEDDVLVNQFSWEEGVITIE
ncbi:uncharacterized protein apof [Halichoeres trimaculatus]|uniref:uncharacterized protein apof n=1 Tax=Halichoeres trimaculatus TaxID=147232 RepID=UPI003D9E47D2